MKAPEGRKNSFFLSQFFRAVRGCGRSTTGRAGAAAPPQFQSPRLMINRDHDGVYSGVQRHAGHAGCAGCAPCALSQRDCVLQPRVALRALPWVTVSDFRPTPTGLRHSQSTTRWSLFKQSGRAKFQVQGDAGAQGRRRGRPTASRMKGNCYDRS
jgi:hypothetical protein